MNKVTIVAKSKKGIEGIKDTALEFSNLKSFPVRKALKIAGINYKFTLGDVYSFSLEISKTSKLYRNIPQTERDKLLSKAIFNLVDEMNNAGCVNGVDYEVKQD